MVSAWPSRPRRSSANSPVEGIHRRKFVHQKTKQERRQLPSLLFCLFYISGANSRSRERRTILGREWSRACSNVAS